MEELKQRNIAQINRDISVKLLDSIYMLEILEDIADSSAKEEVLITKIEENIKAAFHDIEKCRGMISVAD